jgi:hypothetical protein
LVALVCFVNDALFCQFAGSGSDGFLQPPVTDRGFGGLLFLVDFQFDGHGGGIGIEVDVGVVCQSAEPRDILAFQVAFASQQVGIIAVALIAGSLAIAFMTIDIVSYNIRRYSPRTARSSLPVAV